MDVRQTAVDRTAEFEGFVPHFYLDTKGKVTVGYGRMLPNADAAASLPMKLKGLDATDKAKRDEWTTMSVQKAGQPASYYKQFSTLTIGEADARSLLLANLTSAASDLGTRFPALDQYPEAAQDALLDMIFNIGRTNFTKAKWPDLFAAVEGKDWASAAAASNRKDVSQKRNDAIRKLFLDAVPKVYAGQRLGSESLAPQLAQLLRLIATEGQLDRLFPEGVRKLRISIATADVTVTFEGEGSSGSPILDDNPDAS